MVIELVSSAVARSRSQDLEDPTVTPAADTTLAAADRVPQLCRRRSRGATPSSAGRCGGASARNDSAVPPGLYRIGVAHSGLAGLRDLQLPDDRRPGPRRPRRRRRLAARSGDVRGQRLVRRRQEHVRDRRTGAPDLRVHLAEVRRPRDAHPAAARRVRRRRADRAASSPATAWCGARSARRTCAPSSPPSRRRRPRCAP